MLAAAAAVAATAAAPPAFASGQAPGAGRGRGPKEDLIDYRAWSSYGDFRSGDCSGTRPVPGPRPGLVLVSAVGSIDYTDPHTGTTAAWEYATWTSTTHRPRVPAGEVIASWNAHTPPGTWVRTELQGTYSDGTATPWYTLGIWTSGDGDDVPRRTSVEDQGDGRSNVWTDTFAIADLDSGLRLTSYRLRVTLYRAPGSRATPTVWRVGAMASDIPARFEVPASRPGSARGVELDVPRYSQNIHEGQYPEYDGGGEAWCSPTSSQMILEYWGRRPTRDDLAWVNPDYQDPQVCHAARHTFDYAYEGCGNWPFNAAYAASHPGLQAVVTRLDSLTAAERLVAAGIPVITSQSFHEKELTGAGYGTAGHLMTVTGFTALGDVIVNDPAGRNNRDVRRIYNRREFENVWLRTRRKDAEGRTRSASGGVCYLYWPSRATPAQLAALSAAGVR